jgi:hypothetical protein
MPKKPASEARTREMRALGLRLKSRLKTRNQLDYARAAEVSPRTIQHWFDGDSLPDIAELQALARYEGVRPGWLAYDEGAKAPQQVPAEERVLDALRKFESPPYETVLRVLDAIPKPAAPAERPTHVRTRAADAAPLAIDRRDELKRYRIARHAQTGPAIPKWLGLAAGEGNDLELSPDYIYFEKLPTTQGVHSAVVKGDSMLMTLQPGDIVLLQEFPSGRFELPQIETEEEKVPLARWQRDSLIRDGEICVVSINSEPPTLKRVSYDTERGPSDWKLQIIADNPPAWRKGKPFQVAVGDKIVFYARLLGIADEKLK